MLVADQPKASLVGGDGLNQLSLRLVLGGCKLAGGRPGEQAVHVPARARAEGTTMHANRHVFPVGIAVEAIPVGRCQRVGGCGSVLRGRPQNTRRGRPIEFRNRIGGVHDPDETAEGCHHDNQSLGTLLLPGRLLSIGYRPAHERNVGLAFDERLPASLGAAGFDRALHVGVKPMKPMGPMRCRLLQRG